MPKTGRTVRLMITLAAMMLMVMALGVGTAAAQETPYGGDGRLAVDCVAAGQAGASVTCTVSGALPGEQLQVTATASDGTVVYSATLTADQQGQATFRFTVPAAQRGMEITVRVVGQTSGDVGEDTVMVAAPGRTGAAMPRTGASQDTMLLAAAGVFMLAAGATALRRRRSHGRDRTHAGV
jgi:LPXTG-motif cell wall-anchored protein